MNSRAGILGGFIGTFVATAGIILILFLFVFLSIPIKQIKGGFIFKDKAEADLKIYETEFEGKLLMKEINQGALPSDLEDIEKIDPRGFRIFLVRGEKKRVEYGLVVDNPKLSDVGIVREDLNNPDPSSVVDNPELSEDYLEEQKLGEIEIEIYFPYNGEKVGVELNKEVFK